MEIKKKIVGYDVVRADGGVDEEMPMKQLYHSRFLLTQKVLSTISG